MQTAAEIGQHVCREFDAFAAGKPSNRGWHALRDRLVIWCSTLDQDLALEGMLWVFENSGRYQYQELAGQLLHQCNVPLSISAQECVRRIAPTLNASAASVAYYLQDQIGKEECLRLLRDFSPRDNQDPIAVGIRSLIYWLGNPVAG